MSTFNLDWQVDTSQIDRLVSQLTATRERAEAAAKSLDGVTTTVKRTTQATHEFSLANAGVVRELSVMFGEALRGNWTRLEGSMTVLANRTGLLAMAFSPLGATIGIAVGALGLLAVAAVKGAEEQTKLNFAIQSTSNFAGTTSGNLRQLALDMGQATENFKGAKEAVIALTESGRFTQSQIQSIGSAISSMSELGSERVNSLVKEFVRLKDEPVRASAELNKQYHFLTAAIYEQIIALDKQGKSDEAAALAIDALAKHENDAANQIRANMGTLQRLAADGANAFHRWWDEVLGIGRKSDANSALADIDKRIAFQKSQVASAQARGGSGQAEQNALDALIAQRNELNKMKQLVDDNAAAQGRLQQVEQKRVEGIGYLNAHEGEYTSKLKMEREELDRLVQAAKDAGKSQADIDAITAGFWARHKQPKVPGANADNNRDIESLRGQIEQEKVLYEVKVTNLKTQLTQHLITQDQFNQQKYELEIRELDNDIKYAEQAKAIAEKKGVNYKAEAQRWQNDIDKFAAEKKLKQAEEFQAEQQHAEQIRKVQQSVNQQADNFNRQREAAQDKARRQMFMSADEKADADARKAIEIKYQDLLAGEIERLKTAGASTDELSKAVADLNAKRQEALDQEAKAAAQRKTDEGDWTVGARKALKQYQEDAGNVAGQTQKLFTDAFDGMNNALMNFVQTGKLNFADLAKTVIMDLIKMEMQAEETKIFGMLGNMLGGGGGGAVNLGSITGDAASAFWAKGGIFSGINMHAGGDVVSGPTMFNGNNMMGDQGPEAIMPLKRGADGRLGVATQGGGGGSVTVHGGINVSVQGGMTNEQTGQVVATAVAESLKHMPAVADSRIHNAQRYGGLSYGR